MITTPSTDWEAEHRRRAALAALPRATAAVTVVWKPPWTPERLSPTALCRLGVAGRP